jgi:HEPN domain-containing protein
LISSKPPKIVYAWFKYAKDDLKVATTLHTFNHLDMYRNITFNCQQVVEKCIKGLLTYNKIKFDKVHDIKILSESILPIYPDLEDLLERSDKLTKYAVEFRYPDSIDKPISTDEVNDCVEIAKLVFKTCCDKIPFDSTLF